MKKIELDKCNGLDNISISGTNIRPKVSQGMIVALSHKGIPFDVKIKAISEDKVNFTGRVVETDNDVLAECNLNQDDIIKFTEENICYPTQKE